MAEVEGRGSVADADPTECEVVIVSLQKKVKINFAYKKTHPLWYFSICLARFFAFAKTFLQWSQTNDVGAKEQVSITSAKFALRSLPLDWLEDSD